MFSFSFFKAFINLWLKRIIYGLSCLNENASFSCQEEITPFMTKFILGPNFSNDTQPLFRQ